jgi:hypothetical protein
MAFEIGNVLQNTMNVLGVIIFIVFLVLLVRGFLCRNMPAVGGKIGPIRTIDPPPALPRGFSRVYARAMTLFVASDAAGFADLEVFLRDGTVQKPVVMRIYRVAGCKTEIEIPDQAADYERIDAAQALALLRELPDPRRVRRLHLSDERSFLDPWVRKVRGKECFNLGNATNFRSDRRLGQFLGTTLMHEWLHLVAFASTIQVWRFKRANAIEPTPSPAFEPLNFGDRNTEAYEAWCDLGVSATTTAWPDKPPWHRRPTPSSCGGASNAYSAERRRASAARVSMN